MRYRKKPVIIDAINVGDSTTDEIIEFCGGEEKRNINFSVRNSDKAVSIVTLEGTMYAGLNDWLIRGVKGEIYPCKPDIFEVTYELVDGEQS